MLTDDILRLRALDSQDILTLYEWENLSELWNTSATLAPYSRRNLARYIESYDANPFASGELRLMAELTASGCPVGFVDLYGVEVRHRRAYIGILIAPEYHRRGYAKRILGLLECYCRRHLQMHQLIAIVPVDNEASLSLFASCGYIQAAVLPDYICSDGGFIDSIFYHKIL